MAVSVHVFDHVTGYGERFLRRDVGNPPCRKQRQGSDNGKNQQLSHGNTVKWRWANCAEYSTHA